VPAASASRSRPPCGSKVIIQMQAENAWMYRSNAENMWMYQ
jgi:hypothetical protein